MQARLLWEEAPPQKTASRAACYDVAFAPDRASVLCGIGERIYVFDLETGTVQRSLKGDAQPAFLLCLTLSVGHKGIVYCVAWATDGSLFASGGADKTIIVWSSSFEGRVKYTHPESVQCLAFNPVTHQLVSGAASELGVWHTEQRSVAKHMVTSKILSMSWTSDGSCLALGHLDGYVSLRNANVQEQRRFLLDAPVWSLIWRGGETDAEPNLAVCSGDSRFCRYTVDGAEVNGQRLSFCPCSVSAFPSTGALLVCGADKKVRLVNKDGQELQILLERETWTWTAESAMTSKGAVLAVGNGDGSLAMYRIAFEHQTLLAGDWLAQRQGLDGVSVRHVPSNETSTVAFPHVVQNVALHSNQLAVQVGGEVIMHALNRQGRLEVIGKVNVAEPWRCVATTALHVICVLKAEIRALDFSGSVARAWTLESEICCSTLVGGPAQHETLLVGCRNGAVLFLRLHNAVPQLIFEHSSEIVCLDLDVEWNRVAAVDGEGTLLVYDTTSQQKLYEVEGMNIDSVAWNPEFPDLLCYSSGGFVWVKASAYAAIQTTTEGRLVGFRGSAVYTSKGETVSVEPVHLSPHIQRYLEAKQFTEAYALACLGTDDQEWKQLGVECLFSRELKIAKKCFRKLNDMLLMNLTDRLEGMKEEATSLAYFAELYCSLGRFEDAANCFAKAGDMQRALNVFSTMRLYDEGQRWASAYRDQRSSNSEIDGAVTVERELVKGQAQWVEASQDVQKAYELYISVGDYDKALKLIEDHRMVDALRELARQFREDERDLLERCLRLSESFGDTETMEHLLKLLDDHEGLVKLYCSRAQWEKAESLVADAESMSFVCSSQAEWLIKRGEFLKAVDIYAKHDCRQEARELLSHLAQSKRATKMFLEASQLYAKLAPLAEDIASFGRWMEWSELYYAYSIVYDSLQSPFAVTDIGTLFNVSHWLTARLMKLKSDLPKGLQLSHALYAWFKSAQALGAHQIAQNACRRLARLHLPLDWQEEVEVEALRMANSHPVDNPELHSTCFHCREPIETTSLEADACPQCGSAFVRCFITFEKLPVVEFALEESVTVADAVAALDYQEETTSRPIKTGSGSASSAQVLRLSASASDQTSSEDPFEATEAHLAMKPILDLSQLRKLSRRDVLIYQPSTGRPFTETRFYRIMDHSVELCVGDCGHLYILEDYQQCCLEQRAPPFQAL